MAALANLVLLLFTLRRWLFLLAALWPERSPARQERGPHQPEVLLLVPFRNERANLPGLVAALERLDYPAERLSLVLIDDGSSDGGDQIASQWQARRSNRHWLRLARNMGKANALNAALAAYPRGELVAVYDADERPEPPALAKLTGGFADAQVGAVSGRRRISNPLESPFTSHAALESLVHQEVTSRAKDRWQLAPPILGSNCVYRRSALTQVGGFPPGALLEDSDLTLKLIRSGWRTGYVPEAISAHAAPRTLAGYWRQHARWMEGFRAVAHSQARPTLAAKRLPWFLRLELLLFSFGYVDRIAWLVGCLVLAGRILREKRLPGRSLLCLTLSWLTPLLQTAAVLTRTAAPAALWRRVLWLPFFLPLDMLIAAWGLFRSGRSWEARERPAPWGLE